MVWLENLKMYTQLKQEEWLHDLTSAVSWDCGCLKLMTSKARVFLTLAKSASLAACNKECPLNSSAEGEKTVIGDKYLL